MKIQIYLLGLDILFLFGALSWMAFCSGTCWLLDAAPFCRYMPPLSGTTLVLDFACGQSYH